ncbi:pilus assembly protein TadG-related protein [Schlesneria paludicola]|uniref:pilus assembly protein TadG-related protein n=1 Tax=Schlesneria paludicola TaxID=360056 RepID=UPI00029A2DE2|nr:pilus assembly protein TadG-related protein [Schlesneria paludicola]
MRRWVFVNKPNTSRRAAILVLAAIMMIVVIAFAALAIDLGLIALAANQLQNAADAAALAAAYELIPDAKPPFPLKSPLAVGVNVPSIVSLTIGLNLSTSASVLGTDIQVIQPQTPTSNVAAAIAAARDVASKNRCLQATSLQTTDSDVQVYYEPQPSKPLPLLPIPGVDALLSSLILASTVDTRPNTARVTLRSDAAGNSLIPLVFAPALGMKSVKSSKSSSARVAPAYTATRGAKILPIAMDVTIWRALRLGNGAYNGIPLAGQLLQQNGAPVILIDEQRWDPKTQAISTGSDGIWEVSMITQPLGALQLPLLSLLGLSNAQNAAATVVTVRTSSSQSNAQLLSQISNGLDTSPLSGARMTLPFNMQGEKSIPDAVLSGIEATIGEPQVILLYDTLSGTITNTLNQLLNLPQTYKIVGWGGCVVTKVERLGVLTLLKVQPAPYASSTMTVQQSANSAYTDMVFTGPRLVE